MNKSSNNNRLLIFTLSILGVGATLGVLGFVLGFFAGQFGPVSIAQAGARTTQSNFAYPPELLDHAVVLEAPENFDIFWEAYDLIEGNFDGDVPEGNHITHAAIDGLREFVGTCENEAPAELLQFETPKAPSDAPDNFAFFWKTANRLYADCPGDAPEVEDLVYVALFGVTERLDNRYTNIMPPIAAEQFRIDLESGFEGIGTTIEPADEESRTGVRIVKPFEGSPAEVAGIMPKDIIVKVDGEDVSLMSLDDAVRLIRGPKGTVVVLTIQRGDDTPFDIKVTRANIKIPIIRSEITEDNLLHIMLADFSARSGEEVQDALQQGLDAGVKGIILDLRGNPGGRLDMAINITSLFIEDGVIVAESGENEHQTEHDAVGDALVSDLPLVVLVDGGSASASEIVAGAIQDYDRGELIGETTFGKGSVQRLFNLKDGSILRVTVARWFTPEGRQIDGEGLEPDQIVPFEFDPDAEEFIDVQLDAAVDYLLNENESE